jgi:hypothetical protein
MKKIWLRRVLVVLALAIPAAAYAATRADSGHAACPCPDCPFANR